MNTKNLDENCYFSLAMVK